MIARSLIPVHSPERVFRGEDVAFGMAVRYWRGTAESRDSTLGCQTSPPLKSPWSSLEEGMNLPGTWPSFRKQAPKFSQTRAVSVTLPTFAVGTGIRGIIRPSQRTLFM